ncbi:hypothetical protein BHM03_00035637 [Ensete ventricosum]|nr:hypothetical protein BHM03_00035637 [Ensete ventricosum]
MYGWFTHRPRWLSRPKPWVATVYPWALGDLVVVSHPKTWAVAVYPLFTSGLPTGISGKVLPASFLAIPDNLPVSLSLLLVNSLTPSWQAPNTLGELPMHSWRVPNRIVRTLA